MLPYQVNTGIPWRTPACYPILRIVLTGGMMFKKRILKTGVLAAVMMVVFAVFAFRAADWTKGLSSEFIVYGQAGTGSSGGTGSTGSTGTTGSTTTKVVPQIVAGAFDSATFY